MPPKLFSFRHFPKNTSANPLESHTFKTKDLKPFRFIHFQKSGGGLPFSLSAAKGPCSEEATLLSKSRPIETGHLPSAANHQAPVYRQGRRATDHQSLCLSPSISTPKNLASATLLDSALTSKATDKCFSFNTKKKHRGGEGGAPPSLNSRTLVKAHGTFDLPSAARIESA